MRLLDENCSGSGPPNRQRSGYVNFTSLRVEARCSRVLTASLPVDTAELAKWSYRKTSLGIRERGLKSFDLFARILLKVRERIEVRR